MARDEAPQDTSSAVNERPGMAGSSVGTFPGRCVTTAKTIIPLRVLYYSMLAAGCLELVLWFW